ncbi:MAG: UPF0146 family protein [Candidatus Hydrothermarchaeales archaeon]
MTIDYKDFVEYICENYDNAKKIVEVGVGSKYDVLEELDKRLDAIVIGTDIRVNPKDPKIIKDDITDPDLTIYEDADLIYSIRPPIEMHPYIERVAHAVGSDLIIKPLSTEYVNRSGLFDDVKLVNYKSSAFYLFR